MQNRGAACIAGIIGTLLALVVLMGVALLYTTGTLDPVLQADTPTPTASTTVTAFPSFTPSATSTATPSPTATYTPTFTPSPTPSPTPLPPGTILQNIESAWVETQRELRVYYLYAQNEAGGVLGIDRSLRYEAYVTLSAGVDLSLLTVEDITVDGTTVTIILPPPQIKDCILDEAASRYYERNCDVVGVVDIGCGGLENELRQQAINAAATDDVDQMLARAFDDVGALLNELVQLVGIDTVRIVRSSAQLPSVAFGGTCPIPPTALP